MFTTCANLGYVIVVDGEVLALALERGGIPVAHVLSPARRELRRWLSLRRGLVEARAQTVTIARGVCRELGEPLPGGMAKQFVANIRNVTLRPEAARSTRCVPDRGIEQRADLSLAGSTARIGR
jgi:transposase